MKIKLSQGDIRICEKVALERRTSALNKNRPQPYGPVNGNHMKTEIQACIAERGVAQLLGKKWHDYAEDISTLPADVGDDIQVRWTSYHTGHLILHGKDPSEHFYVLVTGTYPNMQIKGFLRGHQAKQKKYWKEKGFDGRPCYAVSQKDLDSFNYLYYKDKHFFDCWSLEELRNYFRYDPDTGFIYERKAGKKLGTKGGNSYIMITRKDSSRNIEKKVTAHTLVWYLHYGVKPRGKIDHKNEIKIDNRINNLEDVTHRENISRAHLNKKKARLPVGVSFEKRYSKNPFKARITVYGKERHLGCFTTAEEASIAYQKALAKIQPNASHHPHAA
jgi:hypothetical protein